MKTKAKIPYNLTPEARELLAVRDGQLVDEVELRRVHCKLRLLTRMVKNVR